MFKEKFNAFKAHVIKHKTVYISVVTGAATAGITFIVMRKYSSPGIPGTASPGIPGTGESTSSIINSINGNDNKVLNSISYVVSNRKGPPSWIIRCLETGQIYTSQHLASVEMELPEAEISKHLNGLIDHVRGYRFERICMAA